MIVNADEIKRLRKEQGMSRTQLEKVSGVDRFNIRSIEQGESRMPRGDVVERLAGALGVEPATLLIFSS